MITTAFHAQETVDENDSIITKKITDYFTLERENIHIQFPKKIFLTNEKIFFKGFVYNITTGSPSVMATNIYATLFNEKGEKIIDKLFYASNGSFTGHFDLNNSFSTGKYYVHFFTNWMKNFKEDESSTNTIQIINISDKSFSKEITPDYSNVTVKFNPEGGTLVENQKNVIGINLSDCNGNPFNVSEGELIDSKGSILQKISLNTFGYGKFEFVPNKTIHKVRFIINDSPYEQTIPLASPEGFSLDINSYSIKDKILLKVKTNQKTLEKYTSKPLKVVINQFNNIILFDLKFTNNEEQNILFENENVSNGVNTIRIVDSDLNVLAERIIFKHPKEKLEVNLQTSKKANDSIYFSGKINFNDTDIAISILPEESIAIDNTNDIYGDFLLNAFLSEKSKNSRYYFNDITTKKKYELDLLLLNQVKSKYEWKEIIKNPPKKAFEFDNGLMLKGTINEKIADRAKTQIILNSPTSANFGEINEKNEFYFDNLILSDSTKINITLLNNKSKILQFKGYPQVLNSRREFNKPLAIEKNFCKTKKEQINVNFPELRINTITLDSIEVKGKTSPVLTHDSMIGNSRLQGFKISGNNGSTLLQFIRMYGFNVENENTSVEVYSSRRNGGFGSNRSSPAIYMDDIPVIFLNSLQQITMREVDEIYIDANMRSSAFPNNIGVIKIYMMKGTRQHTSFNTNISTYPIQKGFAIEKRFKNMDYLSTSDNGFKNFGLINWIPNTIQNADGNFTFKIPDMNQKKVKILIEGFSSDGKLISEIRTIDLQ